MHIVCPNCSTSYAIDPAQLGREGRNVRCSRCKDTWHVRAEDVVTIAAMAEATADPGPAEQSYVRAQADDAQAWQHDDTPVIDSPSISTAVDEGDRDTFHDRFGAKARPLDRLRERLTFLPKLPWLPSIPVPNIVRHYMTLPAGCVAMAALVLALAMWRTDVVRLMPQTAGFFKMVGLEVNLRGLRIENVTVSPEDIDGKPGFVIEGVVTAASGKPAQLPRLRFIVNDSFGAEIYAWTSVLERAMVQPGESLGFRTRLASPPPEAREIAVRFFSRRDIGA